MCRTGCDAQRSVDWSQARVPRSTTAALIGHKTEAASKRYNIGDDDADLAETKSRSASSWRWS